MKVTKVFNTNLKYFNDESVRMIINYGGSSSSKTISILQLLLLYALKHKNKRITIVSETTPKLKRTVLKDFQKIVLPQDELEHLSSRYNKSEMIYSLRNGSEILFLSADSESKIIGMRSDVVYFDEVNHIKKNVYDQLSIRTKEKIIVSYNPSSKFYIMDEFDRDDVRIVHSTYKDNQFVDARIIKELVEKGKKNKNFRRVYLEGKPGVLEGLIFEEEINYNIVDDFDKYILDYNKKNVIPLEYMNEIYGLDFGFQDPTALVKIRLYSKKFIFIELLEYKSKHTPDTLLLKLKKLKVGKGKMIADSARPEMIEYLYKNKINIHSVKKTKIIDGINNMLDYTIIIKSENKELIEEFENYSWKKDKLGEPLEEPIDDHNHCFVGDTLITTIDGDKQIKDVNVDDLVLTTNGYQKVLKNFDNGIKTIFDFYTTIDSNSYVLSSTPTHKIKIDDSWEKIEKLRKNDVIYQNKSLMIKYTPYTKTRDIIVEVLKGYIESSGNIIMEKYQKDFIYIILTELQQIIGSKILNSFQNQNTYQNMEKKELKIIQNGLINFMKKELKKQKNGTNLMKEELGTKNMQKIFLLEIKHMVKQIVNVVEKNLIEKIYLKDFVQINVNQSGEEIVELMMNKEYANIVEKSSQQTNTLKIDFVVRSVVSEVDMINERKENVYDLMIENNHEYFANGILVHNCIDSIRYGLTKINRGGKIDIIMI